MEANAEKKRFLKGYFEKAGRVFIYGDPHQCTMIENAIYKMPASEEKEVLLMRYIEGKEFDKIAGTLHISRATVFRRHAKGLELLRLPKERKKKRWTL